MENGHQNWRDRNSDLHKERKSIREHFFLALIDIIDNHLFKVVIQKHIGWL